MKLGIWMTSYPEAMGWGFWVIFEKKGVSWDRNLEEASWFSNLDEASTVVCYGMRRALLGQMEQSA